MLKSSRAIIVNKQNRLLICKRIDYGQKWEVIGGRLDGKETPVQAIRRELKEEIEYQGNVTFLRIFYNPERNAKIFLFLGKVFSDNLTLSPEHIEYRWITESVLCKYQFLYHDKEMLQWYFETY